MSQYAAQSDRLWLEPLVAEKHLDDYHEMMSDPRVESWTKPTESIAESKAYMAERTPNPEKPWIENYAILLRPLSLAPVNEKPKLIGALGMIRFEAGHGAEVGYGLHPFYHGKGYATEAMKLFLGLYWSKDREGDWNTLVAAIDPDNIASQRVVEKIVKTDRLLLEPLNLNKHLYSCHEILSDLRIAKWSTRGPNINIEQTKDRILESMSSVQFRMWAIMIPSASSTLVDVEDYSEENDMKMIGIIGTSHTPANVGYKIHPNRWGKGYMTEALKLFVEMFWTLEEKKAFPQIVAAYTPGNHASARVLEKVGFNNGQLLREELELWSNRGLNRKSDIQCMYIDRPQFSK
ncbi:hypothetical protein EYC80_007024 [Monilinia laxa]|uniref:N-acetyltransferase domain-containing protein n=1 Tax=Monilinia laxa TaxID=61186 RepID=A0A5N6JZX3_MONLA|nr:hypothetical protein EYC80_007024 [Monilinia laxa]